MPVVSDVLHVVRKSSDASMSKTFAPSWAALIAPIRPPPAPATTRSYVGINAPWRFFLRSAVVQVLLGLQQVTVVVIDLR